LRDLPGRKLLVEDAKYVVLQRPDISTILLSANNEDNRLHHFLLRVVTELRSKLLLRLRALSKFVQYVPHDTFLVALTYNQLKEVSFVKSVADIFKLPWRMKLSSELTKNGYFSPGSLNQQLFRRRVGTQPCKKIQLNVLLPADIEDIQCIRSEMDALCAETLFGNQSLCQIASGSSSRSKMVVNTDECLQNLAVQRLAEHPAVSWVEVRPEMRLRNKYATRIIQSNNGSSWTLWEKGLRGDGEVSMLKLSCLIIFVISENFCRSSGSRTLASTTEAVSFVMTPSRCRHVWDLGM
jgi:hypothetical protein